MHSLLQVATETTFVVRICLSVLIPDVLQIFICSLVDLNQSEVVHEQYEDQYENDRENGNQCRG